ncbi:hypothetical protein GCM10023235_55640 [Kitasatospora terrestris]|uniref:DUF2637 domain-containing protein n=1 Tax=Kitasatospora terrestris TaxID=258051 RepID=A0ABP9E926_9ACTN
MTAAGAVMWGLTFLAVAGGAVLAGIGFTGSYTALVNLGFRHNLGDFSYAFPVGVDVGIVVLLALDLHLIRRRTPWPVLRLLAHGFTAATIYFNAASAGSIANDPTGSAMHAVIPVMFIAAVEAGRRLVIRITRIEAGRPSEGVPLHRWLLAPWPAWMMFRRMRLYGIDSYQRAIELERERIVYRVLLERDHGSDLRKAPADALLPLTMARFGLSVDEALALPAEAEERARLRAERREAFEADLAARADARTADTQIFRLRTQGKVEAAGFEVGAETATAKARAHARTVAAGREAEAVMAAAAAEQEAAEARRRAAETDQAAAETEQAAAETRRRAAETERQAAAFERACAQEEEAAEEARLRAAEAARAAAETEAAAAEARRRGAEADRQRALAAHDRIALEEASEAARLRAAEARRRAAETEMRALEMEDEAKLTPSARGARKVARMILAAYGPDHTGPVNPEAVDLQTIANALGVSIATASQRRADAADLLASGYSTPVHAS